MRRGKRSQVKGDRRIATPKPGPRCVALRVPVGTSGDVSDAPKTVTRTQRGVSDRSAQDLAPPQPFQGRRRLPGQRRLGGPLRQPRQHLPRRRRGDPLQQLDGPYLA